MADGILARKVVVVTGAGRGIGREIALLAAREGAKVVVNDLGGAADGEGGGAEAPAQKVGEAIAPTAAKQCPMSTAWPSRPAPSSIVKTAVENFGRIDCVVNNAGILRDRIFHRMSHVDWELGDQRASLRQLQRQPRRREAFQASRKSGAFVHFTSTSGLVGNFGQANYSAAKMGIVGLSKSIALDMAAFNVRSNCISPFAWTRMIGTIPDRDAGGESARRTLKEDDAGQDRADGGVPARAIAAKDVTAQIFAVRMNEIMLMSQPRPVRSVHRRRDGPRDDRRSRHAGDEELVLPARPLRRHFLLGPAVT